MKCESSARTNDHDDSAQHAGTLQRTNRFQHNQRRIRARESFTLAKDPATRLMGYLGTISLYSTLLALGYVVALFRRGRQTLTNGVILQGKLPPLKPLYVHALLSMIFKPKQLPDDLRSHGSMPKLSINSTEIAVNRDTLAKYRSNCELLSEGKELPILYPAVESFCMNLACMCLPAFPISVIGGVLARYKATMHRAIMESEVLTYR